MNLKLRGSDSNPASSQFKTKCKESFDSKTKTEFYSLLYLINYKKHHLFLLQRPSDDVQASFCRRLQEAPQSPRSRGHDDAARHEIQGRPRPLLPVRFKTRCAV